MNRHKSPARMAAILALGIALGGGLTACEQIKSLFGAASVPVSEMSISEVEARLAENPSNPQAPALKLRLAAVYAKHGSPVQLEKAVTWVSELAQSGNAQAQDMACMSPINEKLGQDGTKFCALSAERGGALAIPAMCSKSFNLADLVRMRRYCGQALERGDSVALLPMGYLKTGGEDADIDMARGVALLERAVLEGPWYDRDPAIAVLRTLEQSPDYNRGIVPKSPNRGALDIGKSQSIVQPRSPGGIPPKASCYVTYSIAPTGVVFDVTTSCSTQSMVEPMRRAMHRWRFQPTSYLGAPAYLTGQSETIRFQQNP